MSWSLSTTAHGTRWDSFFDDFWSKSGELLGTSRRASVLPVNAWLGEEDAVVRVKIPGVEPSEVDISVDGNTLKVSGERHDRQESDGEQYHRRERFTRKFERQVRVPFQIDAKGVEALYENGILEVHLPRTAADRPRKIKVRGK